MDSSTDQIKDIPEDHPNTGVMGRVLDGLAHLCVVISGALLVFLIVSFGWLVFGRYILNNTPTWVEQSSLLIVVYITCLGAAAGVRHNTHLSIDMVREALPAIPRVIMCYLADLFVLVFGAFMTWQGGILVMDNTTRAIPMIGLTESWRAAPLAICGVLMVLFAGANMIERLTHTTRV